LECDQWQTARDNKKIPPQTFRKSIHFNGMGITGRSVPEPQYSFMRLWLYVKLFMRLRRDGKGVPAPILNYNTQIAFSKWQKVKQNTALRYGYGI
jgi:hypothetical protein